MINGTKQSPEELCSSFPPLSEEERAGVFFFFLRLVFFFLFVFSVSMRSIKCSVPQFNIWPNQLFYYVFVMSFTDKYL